MGAEARAVLRLMVPATSLPPLGSMATLLRVTVTRRLIELAAADALSRMRSAAARGNWAAVDRMLEEASRQFAGNEWVASILAAMRSIADSRERERAMKEMMYSSARLRDRLASTEEAMQFSIAAEIDVPAFLRRKTMQGKAEEKPPAIGAKRRRRTRLGSSPIGLDGQDRAADVP